MAARFTSRKLAFGFTLAELLIALAILGVSATFTIPKILNAHQNSQKVAVAKETAAMISGAFQAAKLAGAISSATKPSDLTAYMNYVALDTSGTVIDSAPAGASNTCNTSFPCIKLHNGGYLMFRDYAFNGTTTLNGISFVFDPDPAHNTTDTADGPLKAVQFTLYYDGFITTRGNAKTGSTNAGYPSFGPDPSYDPSWFTWN
jgi:prepilin-type N-terminal cleavage/methylation domain-containing protein